jgi:purine-binding chemotaxis protein CheW
MTTEFSNDVYSQTCDLLIFNLSTYEFGFEIELIREIIRVPAITPIPKTPKFLKGVSNFRGKILPIINLKQKLGLENEDTDSKTRIIVIEIKSQLIGFLVDRVIEVAKELKIEVQFNDEIIIPIWKPYLTGVIEKTNRRIFVLNFEKLLDFYEK